MAGEREELGRSSVTTGKAVVAEAAALLLHHVQASTVSCELGGVLLLDSLISHSSIKRCDTNT